MASPSAPKGRAGARPLVHNVFFTLTDPSPQAIARLVEACRTLLSGHPGELYFAAGPLAAELDRPVNVRDFHVALCVVFASKADHDAYQVAPTHLRFIEENKATWRSVRVFDSYEER